MLSMQDIPQSLYALCPMRYDAMSTESEPFTESNA